MNYSNYIQIKKKNLLIDQATKQQTDNFQTYVLYSMPATSHNSGLLQSSSFSHNPFPEELF